MLNKIMGYFSLLTNSRFLARRLQFAFIKKEVSGQHFNCAVDLGAGRAPYKKLVSANRYIGVDVEDRRSGVELLIADLDTSPIPLSDNTADLVIATEALEHFSRPPVVIKEVYRILKPGGRLVLTTPFVWPIHEAPHDFYRYTNFSLQFLLKEAGFLKYKVYASNNFLYTLCQLVAIKLNYPILKPLLILVNVLGYLTSRWANQGDSSFPLGYRVVAEK